MFKKLVKGSIIALFTIALLLPQASIAKNEEVPVKKITEMLYPSVLVDLGRVTGSGTIIFSDERTHESWKEEKIWTFVLTNYHVIRGAITIEEVFDPKQGKNIQKETRRPVHVRLWDYNDFSTAVGTTGRVARIIAWDKDRDLALLRLDDKERKIKHVAKLWPENVGGPYLFQTVWAIGSGMSNPPYPTQGLLSGISGKDRKGRALYLSSSPIIFGNSGGAVYRWSSTRKKYEYIGIPSRISIQPMGFSADAITHMGYFIPIDRIYSLLEDNDYQFIYNDSISIDECKKARKKKQKPKKEKERIAKENANIQRVDAQTRGKNNV